MDKLAPQEISLIGNNLSEDDIKLTRLILGAETNFLK